MDNNYFFGITDVFGKVVAPLLRQNHNAIGNVESLPHVTAVGVPALFKGFLELSVVIVKNHVLASLAGHAGHNRFALVRPPRADMQMHDIVGGHNPFIASKSPGESNGFAKL